MEKLFIIIALAATFVSGVVFSFANFLYGNIAAIFIEYVRSITNFNTTGKIKECEYSENNFLNSQNDIDARFQITINYFLLFGSIVFIFMNVSYIISNTTSEKQIKRMRNQAFKSIVRQDMLFFDAHLTSDFNYLLTRNIENVKEAINHKLVDFLCSFTKSISNIIIALIQSPKFTALFLTGFLVSFMFIRLISFVIKKYTDKETKAYNVSNNIAQETLGSIRTVVCLGLQNLFISNYQESLRKAEKLTILKGLWTGILSGLSMTAFNFSMAIGIYYGVVLINTECIAYNANKIMATIMCMLSVSTELNDVIKRMKTIGQESAAKVYDLIETKSKIDVFENNGIILDNLRGSIEFEKINFTYPNRPGFKTFNELSFKIQPGSTVAIVGSSGGGKSSIVCLLQQFYRPMSGIIKIDGININELNLIWLRSQMALVSQEPNLFSYTIRENIRLGRLNATDHEVEFAAKMANAHEFIMKLPMQYDTFCGERGIQLSGGQKQRIAIARALIRNPKILLLDEATSAMDYETEKIVQDELDRIKAGRTTIIIAHRLSTIKNADLILVLSNGKLVEMGKHEELMSSVGFYYNLVSSQTKSNSNCDAAYGETKQSTSFILNKSFETKEDLNDVTLTTNTDTKTVKNKTDEKKIFYYERKLLKLQRDEMIWFIIGLISQIFNGIFHSVFILIICQLYNILTLKDGSEQINLSKQFMLFLIGIDLIYLISITLKIYSNALTSSKLTNTIRHKMFKSLIRQEISFHDIEENKSSILCTLLSLGVPLCKGLTDEKIGILSQCVGGMSFAIIYSFISSWRIALFMLAIILIITIFQMIQNALLINNTRLEEASDLISEVVNNMKTIASLGREDFFLNKFNELFRYNFKDRIRKLLLESFIFSFLHSFLVLFQAAIFSFGFYLLKNNLVNITDFFTSYGIILFSSWFLARVYSQMPDQAKCKIVAKNAFDIIERKSKIDSMDENGFIPDEKLSGDIKFSNVYFSYPNRPNMPILNGLNLVIKYGQTNALVGYSGSGKSTIISLLLRFYDIESGSIEMFGIDIRKLNIPWLRSKIAVVSQEPVLFSTSISENIRFGDLTRDKINMHEVVQVSIQSNIHEKILQLPEKYDTTLASKSGGLISGGEKQRIAIARALIRKPIILLLDEATSALDNQSEQVVQEALDRAQLGRTSIIIAHRLSTIEKANKINFLKDGQVIEEGAHMDLMKNKKYYFDLQTKT